MRYNTHRHKNSGFMFVKCECMKKMKILIYAQLKSFNLTFEFSLPGSHKNSRFFNV